ncbi:MAG: hypothetical protein R6U96_10525 [Promethearchaeia archaeon]
MVIVIILFAVFTAVLFSPEIGHIEREHAQANVILFSNQKETPLSRALNIDENAINLTVITKNNYDDKWREDIYQLTDVIIVDRFLPQNITDLKKLISNINGTEGNCGFIFFGGIINVGKNENDFTSDQISLIKTILPFGMDSTTNTSTEEKAKTDYKIQITIEEEIKEIKQKDKAEAHILVRHIAWPSCPLISKRLIVKSKSSTKEIIKSIDEEHSIISEQSLGPDGGTVLGFSMIISGESQDGNKYNEPFTLWPYFNYLMYVSVFHVHANFMDSNIESFAEWPFSPIPHLTEIILWFTMIAALWIVTIYWFLKMRKKKISKPTEEEKKAKNTSENSIKK